MANRITRKALNRLADHIEAASEGLVARLRDKAQRELRVKPLAFETDSQRMLREITEGALRSMMPSVIESIRRSPMIYDPLSIGRGVVIRVPDATDMRQDLKAYRYGD